MVQTRQSVPRVPPLRCKGGRVREGRGRRRWIWIQAGSACVGGSFPPVGSDPPRLRRWSRQNAARGPSSPESGRSAGPGAPDPQRRRRSGSREAPQGTPEWVSSLTSALKGTSSRAASPWRPALPGIPPNSINPKIPKIPKAKLQAGLQKFGNGLPGFPASCPDSRHHQCGQGRAPLRVAIAPQGHPPRPRGTSLRFLRVKVPSPGFRAGVGRAPASSRFLPPPAPTQEKENLGPARILWNVLRSRLYVRFHRTARCKIAGFGALE